MASTGLDCVMKLLVADKAINNAKAVGLPPAAKATLMPIGTNNFMTQSNPVLAMISGPAGYQSREFWRTGVPLTLLYLGITLITVNLVM